MKKYFCLILCTSALIIIPLLLPGQQKQSAKDSSIIVMTYNIRFNNPDDGTNSWPYRKERLMNMVKNQDSDLIGLQEALKDQVADLSDFLKDYEWTGVGRDDGKEKGEYAIIFFRKNRFHKLDAGYFWLSEKPEIPGSIGWDADCTRIVTWIKLKDKKTVAEIFLFNTHFDHSGEKARTESAKLMLRRIRGIAGDKKVIITGDFNCSENSVPYNIITGSEKDYYFEDCRNKSESKPTGPNFSYSGFEAGKTKGELIDFIFVRNIKKVLTHNIIDESYNGFYLSDHLPVVVKLIP
jgi:endonuclease/exonuclease/phosphatase family metal-dependent hydrolase